MVHENGVESPSEEWCSAEGSLGRVGRVVLKEPTLILEGSADGLLLVDIALATVHDGDIAEPQWDDPPGEDVDDIGTLVPRS
jgi:hypothetical protein